MTYTLVSVDPGPRKSAVVWSDVWGPEEDSPVEAVGLPYGVVPYLARWWRNDMVFFEISQAAQLLEALAVEIIASGYEGSGRDLFDTQLFAGRLCGLAEARELAAHTVYRNTAAACVGEIQEGGARTDAEVRRALIAIYGGKQKAIGGGRCKTCRKPEGWIGRDHAPCPNCNSGGGAHGSLGLETPLGPLACLGSVQHSWDALAVGITAARRIAKCQR